LDKETGIIFSLGDERVYIEAVFGSGECATSEHASNYEGDFERFWFYRDNGDPAVLVEFMDGKAIDISQGDEFELAHISFLVPLDDLSDTFQYADWMIFDNNRHAFMFYVRHLFSHLHYLQSSIGVRYLLADIYTLRHAGLRQPHNHGIGFISSLCEGDALI